VDLPITAVKIALGIHTRAAREKPYLWGTIGYIPQPTKVKSGGQRELVDSRHHDGTIPYFEMLDNEGRVLQEETKKRGKNAAKNVNTLKMDSLQKAQDLHCWKATQNMCASPQNSIEWYLEEHLSQQPKRLQKDP